MIPNLNPVLQNVQQRKVGSVLRSNAGWVQKAKFHVDGLVNPSKPAPRNTALLKKADFAPYRATSDSQQLQEE